MRARFLMIAPLVLLAACQSIGGSSPAPKPSATDSARVLKPGESISGPVLLTAADGTKVYGNYTRVGSPKALILLFHQAGSSKAEYATIQPRLAKLGFASLAIDARAGGDLFGKNETIAHLGHEGTYGEAKQDMDAAINFALNAGPPVILWGSSYSAAWVFPLAAEHRGQIAGVMAFSPAEYLSEGKVAQGAALLDHVPVFITSAKDSDEIAAAHKVAEAVPDGGATQFVPEKGGVHGSSTLLADKDPDGAAENWAAVEKFLSRYHRPDAAKAN